MSKKQRKEQEGSFEEDMRAFFDSAVFVEKPKRKRKSRERKYRRGQKGKTEAKEEKEIPATLGNDLGAFFDSGAPDGRKGSRKERKDQASPGPGKKDRDDSGPGKVEEKADFEENLRGFFRDAIFEDQAREDGVKGQSFMCPHCGKRLSIAVDECECGASFVEEDKRIEAEITEFLDELAREDESWDDEAEDALPVDEEPESREEPAATIEAESLGEEDEEAELTVTPERLRRDRICFYAGSVLLLLGGPVIILGSWLHDWFMVPIVGTTYDAFGGLNVTFVQVGLLILIIGIVLFAISLRGGIITKKELKKLKAKGRDA